MNLKADLDPGRTLNLKSIDRIVDEKVRDNTKLLMSQRRLIWRSFVGGIFTGLGGVVGATIGVAILAAILLKFGNLPIVGQYLQSAGQRIEQASGQK
jgi:hypothetical protein